MLRFRSRRFAMLLILMLTVSMAFQGIGLATFADPETQLMPPADETGADQGTAEATILQPAGAEGEGVEAQAMGSIKTTDASNNVVNMNVQYANKQDVYVRLEGFSSGTYYIRVVEPDGTPVLGSGSFYKATNKFTDLNISVWNNTTKPGGGQGYNDTGNPGLEYKVEVSSSSSFHHSDTKSDNFKVRCTPNPLVDIQKSVGPSEARPGDTVTYTIAVSNIGNVALTNVAVSDPMLGDLSGHNVASLAVGGHFSFTVNYTIPQETLKSSFPILNTATVGTAEGATDSDGASVSYKPLPHVALDKSVDKAAAKAGDTVIYTFTVTNDGELDLEHLWLDDALFNPDLHINVGDLDIGHSYTTTRSYTIPLDAVFPIVNTANVHNRSVSAEDRATVERMLETGISLEKAVNPESARPGETVVYSFTVNNIGETDLTGVLITDEMFEPDLTIDIGDLASGASLTTTHSYTIPATFTAADFPIENTAVVTADQKVSDRASADVYYRPIAAIDVEKTVSPSAALIGDTVTYTIVVTNTGDFMLYHVAVNDSDIGFTTLIDELAPGASQTFTPTYTILSGDVADNQFVNHVQVEGNTCPPETVRPSTFQIECVPVSDSDEATVTIGTAPDVPGEPGGPTTTTTTVVPHDADPPVTTLPVEPTPLAAPVIEQPVTLPEEVVPLGVPVLPKTGELPVELFYGLGGVVAALGTFLKRK